MTSRGALQAATNEHGEVHAHVQDVGEVELRRGTTTFRDDHFIVESDDTDYYFAYEHVTYFYRPDDVFAH